MSFKKLIPLLSLSSMILISGCSQSPDSATKDYFNAWCTGDAEKLYSMSNEQLKQIMKMSGISNFANDVKKDCEKKHGISTLDVKTTKITSSEYEYTVDILYGNGESAVQSGTMEKLDGNWVFSISKAHLFDNMFKSKPPL